MRAGTLEVTGGKITSPVAVPCSNSCSVPKCNNDLYLSVVIQINVLLMLLLLQNNILLAACFPSP